MLIAQIFVDIGCGNLACSNSTDYGSGAGYAVAAGENALIIGQLTAGQCGNGTAFNLDACFLKGAQHDALADGHNDNIAGNAL